VDGEKVWIFQEGRGRFDFSRRQSAAKFCHVLRTFDRERQRREGQRGGLIEKMRRRQGDKKEYRRRIKRSNEKKP